MSENFIRMDEPITKGPLPRWQKKCIEASNSSINASLNMSKNKFSTSTSNASFGPSRTPNKKNGSSELQCGGQKTPSKTPKKSPGRSNSNTPGKNSKTPNGGDRFIPMRSATSFDLGNYLLNHQGRSNEEDEAMSPSKLEAQRVMAENLHGGDVNSMRILVYKNKAPTAPEGFQNRLKVVYSNSKTPSSIKSSSRFIPHAPDRILDAPDIMDDYYLNLIDWSSNNILAVALSNNVYLWNAASGNIEQLMMLEGSDYVCSLSWTTVGSYLAVGTSSGTVDLWDCAEMKKLRTMGGHSARVGSLSWNNHILTSGSRTGQIIHHDVRHRDHIIVSLTGHSQEVCGLKWSPDGKYLASGGNDNLLMVWAAIPGQSHTGTTPLYTLNSHQAAVKALAWCPWQPYILASGGGTADRCIRFWNCNTGACINTIDTKSQVCGLLWSTTYKEFISGHGFANNQLIIWKYPALTKVAELTGHTSRVLHLAISPDGSTVLSAGADETLRLWKCFAPDAAKKKEMGESKAAASIFKRGIR